MSFPVNRDHDHRFNYPAPAGLNLGQFRVFLMERSNSFLGVYLQGLAIRKGFHALIGKSFSAK